jgi:hypothetical protein
VLQGDNDPRVPNEEAQQVVDILKKESRVGNEADARLLKFICTDYRG